MCRYAYVFHREVEDGEISLNFPRFPEIISSIDEETFGSMSKDEEGEYCHDAVVTALQAVIAMRDELPEADNPNLVRGAGFVHLSVRESMKLELYRLYKENCNSVADFARILKKPETAARRLLDLRHSSKPSEIEKAISAFGKQLVHDWSLEPATLATPPPPSS